MNKWDDELLKIFDEAPFVGIKPAAKKSTVNDRLLRSFDEITEFVERNNRVPEDVGGDEGRLFARLRGIQSETWKREKCLPFDRLGLLAEQASQSPNDAIKDIFEDPIFNLAPETQAIFDIPDYMRKPVDIERPDYIARRVECKDFKEYEAGFRAVHDDLWNGKRKLIKFKDDHLHEGAYFVVGGVLVLLDRLEAISKNKDYKKDGRTRCIYENGTESDILLQTLAKSLYTDGYSIVDVSLSDDDYLKQNFTITDVDIPSGYIYVLRSKSNDPEISSIRNLYKIGFTTQTVEERIANARNDATYLFADVEIVASWKVYNVKAVAFENIIHKIFGDVQLHLSADNARPKEWFIVPYKIIAQAVDYIIRGQKIAYDAQLHKLDGWLVERPVLFVAGRIATYAARLEANSLSSSRVARRQ